MKKTIVIALIGVMALISAVSGIQAQDQTPQPRQGGMMHQSMMCPMMARMTQGGSGQPMMNCPMMQQHHGSMMQQGNQDTSAPQAQTPSPAAKPN